MQRLPFGRDFGNAMRSVFGTHPDGWSDADLAEKETLWRRHRSKTVPG